MLSLNQVVLAGNLTFDPESRQAGGSSVTRLRLAVNRRYTTGAGEQREETLFVDVEVWGRTAENCERFLRKGAPVYVEGRLRMDEWEDRETGAKRSALKVVAQSVQFLGPPAGEQQQSQRPVAPRSAPPPPPPPAASFAPDDDDPGDPAVDDIPF